MTTAYLTHPSSRLHDTGDVHPECAARLPAIEEQLITDGILDFLNHVRAPEATKEQLLRVHSKAHVERVFSSAPDSGHIHLDSDTVMSPGSLEAALHSAGAAAHAAELVFRDDIDDAFCCTRPPGHHATRDTAMGFCLFNNIAVGAAHALATLGLKRVAIIDFDVHHGNGTEDIFLDDERVMFCSTYQRFLYPGIEAAQRPGRMVSVGLQPGDGSSEFRSAVEDQWMPAIDAFKPEMFFISAGFDAHTDDDIGQLNFVDDDFAWVTNMMVEAADRHAKRRVVSCLEGGYELPSLARAAAMHIKTLIGP
jgi:acetoin utilization deacetylase AcuC-like enzyme